MRTSGGVQHRRSVHLQWHRHRNLRAAARTLRGESRRPRHQARDVEASRGFREKGFLRPHADSAEYAERFFEHESHESAKKGTSPR